MPCWATTSSAARIGPTSLCSIVRPTFSPMPKPITSARWPSTWTTIEHRHRPVSGHARPDATALAVGPAHGHERADRRGERHDRAARSSGHDVPVSDASPPRRFGLRRRRTRQQWQQLRLDHRRRPPGRTTDPAVRLQGPRLRKVTIVSTSTSSSQSPWAGWTTGYGFGGSARVTEMPRAAPSGQAAPFRARTGVGQLDAGGHCSAPTRTSACRCRACRRTPRPIRVCSAATCSKTSTVATCWPPVRPVSPATKDAPDGIWQRERNRQWQLRRLAADQLPGIRPPLCVWQHDDSTIVATNMFTSARTVLRKPARATSTNRSTASTPTRCGVVGGASLAGLANRGGRTWVPELRAVWMHEFLDPTTTLTAIFAPVGGSSFATRGLDFGRDWAILGGGTQYVMSAEREPVCQLRPIGQRPAGVERGLRRPAVLLVGAMRRVAA